MVIYPSRKQLVLFIPLILGLVSYLFYTLMQADSFSSENIVSSGVVSIISIFVMHILVKQVVRVLKGGPSLEIDEKGLLIHTNILYGKFTILWKDIQSVEPVTYNSSRQISYNSLKVIPKDYKAFLDNFSFIKQSLIKMSTLGFGKAIDVPQMMLNKDIKEIYERILEFQKG